MRSESILTFKLFKLSNIKAVLELLKLQTFIAQRYNVISKYQNKWTVACENFAQMFAVGDLSYVVCLNKFTSWIQPSQGYANCISAEGYDSLQRVSWIWQ